MTSALARRPFPLIPLALLAACSTETSNERVLGIQAMSFANSEWSEPVHLDAPVNSPCQDQTPPSPRTSSPCTSRLHGAAGSVTTRRTVARTASTSGLRSAPPAIARGKHL